MGYYAKNSPDGTGDFFITYKKTKHTREWLCNVTFMSGSEGLMSLPAEVGKRRLVHAKGFEPLTPSV